ncbi:MAG: DUF4830 domain-containing protein [Hydrogenoanaerobacterium sp.]
MFVRSYKVSGRRILGVGLMFLAATALVIYGVGQRFTKTEAQAEVELTVKEKKPEMRAGVKTQKEREKFVAQFGWQVLDEPTEITEIIIPEEFDEVYEEYNTLQKAQGYDLERQKGKRCKRYTYKITNYTDCPEDARINILVHDGKVIGGDVCSTEQGGFIHGFDASSEVMLGKYSLPAPSVEETAVAEETITAATAIDEGYNDEIFEVE